MIAAALLERRLALDRGRDRRTLRANAGCYSWHFLCWWLPNLCFHAAICKLPATHKQHYTHRSDGRTLRAIRTTLGSVTSLTCRSLKKKNQLVNPIMTHSLLVRKSTNRTLTKSRCSFHVHYSANVVNCSLMVLTMDIKIKKPWA